MNATTGSLSSPPSNPLSTSPQAPTNDALKFFLANVGFSQTAPQIQSYIQQYFGPVNCVKLIPHRDQSSTGGATTKHRGYGFLYMLTEEGSAALENYANAFPGNKIRLLDRDGVYVAKHDESRVGHGQGQGQGPGDASAYAAAAVSYATTATTTSVAAGYDASSTTPYSYEAVNVTAGTGYAQYYDAAVPSQPQPPVSNYSAYYTQQPSQPPPQQQQQQQVYSSVPQQNQPLVPAASQPYAYAAVPSSSSTSYANATPSSGIIAPAMLDNQYDRPSTMSQHYTAQPAVGAAAASAVSYSQPPPQTQLTTMGYLQPQQQQPTIQQQQQPTMTYSNPVYPQQPQQQPQPPTLQQQQQQQYSQPSIYQPPMDGYNAPPVVDGYKMQQGYTAYNPPPRQMQGQQQQLPPQQQVQQQQHGGRGYAHPSGGTKNPRNTPRGGRGQNTSRGGGPSVGNIGMRMGGSSMGGRGAPPPPPPMYMNGPMSSSMGMLPPPPPPPPMRGGGRGRGGGRTSFHQGGRQGGRNRDLRRDRPY
ncbi:hypothetical protein HJC23_004378 [Cyclotella cryptica]|uniref:RRM domain-containing protein n=1 Tax=Cyclotella cryptica TaxID=29204 RepID=A0ABD3PI10_9STRA|eukprot:CCRYP_014580-RA/>CCRYP_014580-RA protein AED:0.26 eAED:0.26 QI:0/-1/0/1/-1/1/1/0/527